MTTLRLTDDLAYRIARVRQAVDQGDPVALQARQRELADAVIAAADRATAGRQARLVRVQRPPAPLAVETQGTGLKAQGSRRSRA